ncbi:hypothetical protein BDQ12DRAFT_663510 [Crucibulum laeve]|uniref:Uncharacterized protein n=1 Tax=Crucibulum laeve TaxID=68775 RepID=A0A5C3MBJ9_9AGAR|nr:hypothetical protein BDQ12DRAFT_663510 [Crucibulum laeve]
MSNRTSMFKGASNSTFVGITATEIHGSQMTFEGDGWTPEAIALVLGENDKARKPAQSNRNSAAKDFHEFMRGFTSGDFLNAGNGEIQVSTNNINIRLMNAVTFRQPDTATTIRFKETIENMSSLGSKY